MGKARRQKKSNPNTRRNRDDREKESIRKYSLLAIKNIKSLIESIPKGWAGFPLATNKGNGYPPPVIDAVRAYLMSGKMDIPNHIVSIYMKMSGVFPHKDDSFGDCVSVWERVENQVKANENDRNH